MRFEGFLSSDADLREKFSISSKIFNDPAALLNFEKGSIFCLLNYSKRIDTGRFKELILLNIHNSLLPRYRGRHAFVWSLANGESRFGYTLHRVREGIDCGEIIKQWDFELLDADINDVLRYGNSLIREQIVPFVETRLEGTHIQNAKAQNEDHAFYVRMRNLSDNEIDWSKSTAEICNLIKAVSPPYTPGAHSNHRELTLFFKSAQPVEVNAAIETPGTILEIDGRQNSIIVSTRDGNLKLQIADVQSEGASYFSLVKGTVLNSNRSLR